MNRFLTHIATESRQLIPVSFRFLRFLGEGRAFGEGAFPFGLIPVIVIILKIGVILVVLVKIGDGLAAAFLPQLQDHHDNHNHDDAGAGADGDLAGQRPHR